MRLALGVIGGDRRRGEMRLAIPPDARDRAARRLAALLSASVPQRPQPNNVVGDPSVWPLDLPEQIRMAQAMERPSR